MEPTTVPEPTIEQTRFINLRDAMRDRYLAQKATSLIQEAAVNYGEIAAWKDAAESLSRVVVQGNQRIAELETEVKRQRRRLGPDPKRGRPKNKPPVNGAETSPAPAAGGVDTNPTSNEVGTPSDPVSTDTGTD